jgi:hypothetical protein
MTTVRSQPGITFAVDDVVPATTALPEAKMHEVVRGKLDGRLESCCDYHTRVVKDVHHHPLLAAVFTAYSQHRPLVLTPDAVWITIAQGVAHHMRIHAERLRDRFVSHQARLTLEVKVDGWVLGSPENPWPEAFAGWAGQIRDHVGPALHNALVCDFSTSGPDEIAASHVVMMDIFETYFHYHLICICGIPSVTLTGSTGDWVRLVEKAEALRSFEMDWWLEHLTPILRQFARAAAGDVDVEHWQAICKLRAAYGGEIINGWVCKLFPYLRAYARGPCTRKNPIFDTGDGMTGLMSPTGLSHVPFTWDVARTGPPYRQMEAIGGLLGVRQDSETLAVEPVVGWAVREAKSEFGLLEKLVARLAAEQTVFPGRNVVRQDQRGHTTVENNLPEEVGRFYMLTNGADLNRSGSEVFARIVPVEQMEELDWSRGLPQERPMNRCWFRFVDLPDGSCMAINVDWNARGHAVRTGRLTMPDLPARVLPVCRVMADTRGVAGRNPVVALTLEEVLEQLLNCGGDLGWLAIDRGYGDAEDFTRRESFRAQRRANKQSPPPRQSIAP